MKIYAHRGASAEYPENTMAAFQRAIDLGADGIELDVHLSADGVPVVIHDETVDRTTDVTGPVSAMTAAELGSIDAGRGHGVPTLADVLDLVGNTLHVNIEIKSNQAGQAVIDEVNRRPDLRWAISSFDWDVLRFVKGALPGADLWPLTYGPKASLIATIDYIASQEDVYPGARAWAESLRTTGNVLEDALDLARDLGSSTLSVGQYGLTEAAIGTIHGQGFAAWVWTVDEPERARELASWGANSLCTNEPAIMLRAGLSAAGRP